MSEIKYIVIDPSGSYNEGKGHTGVISIVGEDWTTLEVQSFDAKNYNSRTAYWSAIIKQIVREGRSNPIEVIIESFQIRTCGFMLGKMPETILFIGAIEYICEINNFKYVTQTPTAAKSRFKDAFLGNYIPNFEYRSNGRYYLNNKQVNDHVRDSLKHLLYYFKYRKDK